MEIRKFTERDISEVLSIWNDVVEEGISFPQIQPMAEAEGIEFFNGQSFTGVAEDNGEIIGIYILHPNNIGRCGHICNASYAVRRDIRNKHIGEGLVTHCMQKAAELGYRILQFNAVVKTNAAALHLYDKLGFTRLGIVPGGFAKSDGGYEDIVLFYHELV